jgi:predicted LPLAT superfamily acyltransferase
MLTKSADAPRADSTAWTQIPERGNRAALKFATFVATRLGRRVACWAIPVVAAYFVTFVPPVRRHAREYLQRALGRKPRFADMYRQVHTFGVTLLDRFYLIHGRYDLFSLRVEGEEAMQEVLGRGAGAFLLGAHVGSFEMLGAAGRQNSGLHVAMAMYDHQAGRLAALFRTSSNIDPPQVIALGHVDSMLRIHACLDEGKFVGMLADRTMVEAPAHVVNFLGTPALFPSGPMRLAAALRRPVIFMAAVYRGGNRYHAVFCEIADFSKPSTQGREVAVRAAIERYVGLLEATCRSDPYNWFNFYDFWQGTLPPASAARLP